MKTKHLIAALVILSSFELAFACGPEWTYIGSDYEIPNYIHEIADSAGIFIRGIPGMGVYRWTELDTSWELISLPRQGANEIKEFPNYPHQLFAQIGCGDLSRSSDNGFTWNQIRVSNTGNLYEYTDFLISPINSTNWYLACHTPTMDDDIFVSVDSGSNWQRIILQGFCSKLLWFAETPDLLYSGRRGSLNSIRMADYGTQLLTSIDTDHTIISLIRHPVQPWIYLLGDGNSGILVRYNVVTGETISLLLPDTITMYYANYSYLRYASGRGLLVGGNDHLYLLSDDLQSLQVIDGPVPDVLSSQILFASADLWMVEINGRGLYCRSPIEQAVQSRTENKINQITFYPNPARETISFIPAGLPIGRVEISNILGQRVAEWSGASTLSPISVSLFKLGSGSYFYQLYPSSSSEIPIQSSTFTIVK